MLLTNGVGPVCAHHESVEVAHDEQGRIFECEGILLKLGKGCIEVLALALVFPSKMAAFLDVSPTLASATFGGTSLEGIEVAAGVYLRWGGFSQHMA